jgi:mannosidase alpha-like ER degradation enhancer 1
MNNGQIATVNVDSLSAFFPGLQAMMGDIEA